MSYSRIILNTVQNDHARNIIFVSDREKNHDLLVSREDHLAINMQVH